MLRFKDRVSGQSVGGDIPDHGWPRVAAGVACEVSVVMFLLDNQTR